jgi:basic membrane protein A and related proteins
MNGDSYRCDSLLGANQESSLISTNRRTFLTTGAAAIGTIGLAGCLGDDNGGDSGQIAIVSSPAGFDDNAFNDNALLGLQEAEEEYDIEINTVEETESANYEGVQSNLADEGTYDLIVLVSADHLNALEQNAPTYEEQNWMLINDHVDEPNVSGWIEANHEMSFLAGVLAATMTSEELEHEDSSTDPDEEHIGFVGGEDTDLINAFEQSYIEGAEWVNEDIDVSVGYAGSFSDTSSAASVASSQYGGGADIIYHAASAAGTGVFSAAQSEGRFAIGVDSDQSESESEYQDVIIGSAVKMLNEATYEVAEAVANDDFESVAGENELTTEDEGIDIVIGQAFEGELPDVVDENIEQAKQEIIDDEIDFTCGPTGC